MLPSEVAIWVGEELRRRFCMPWWQLAILGDRCQPLRDPPGPFRDGCRASSPSTVAITATVDGTLHVLEGDRGVARGKSRPQDVADALDGPHCDVSGVYSELEEFMHLWALNRRILLTPFHNMALMAPATTRRRRPPHGRVRGRSRCPVDGPLGNRGALIPRRAAVEWASSRRAHRASRRGNLGERTTRCATAVCRPMFGLWARHHCSGAVPTASSSPPSNSARSSNAEAGRVLCRQGQQPGQLVVIVSGRVITVAPIGRPSHPRPRRMFRRVGLARPAPRRA